MNILIKMITKLKYVFEFIISIGLMVNIQQILILNSKAQHIRYRFIILTILFAIILLTFIINSIKNNRKSIEKLFLTFMIPIGIFYIVFVIPNRAYDEAEHVYRAYNVSKGIFIAEQNELGDAKTLIPEYIILKHTTQPINTYEDIKTSIKETTNYENEISTFNSARRIFANTLYFYINNI